MNLGNPVPVIRYMGTHVFATYLMANVVLEIKYEDELSRGIQEVYSGEGTLCSVV